VATIEERVAYLEGSVEGHSDMVDGIRDALVSLEARMDRRFEGLEHRFDQRLSALDRKIDEGFAASDRKFSDGFAASDRKFSDGFAASDRRIRDGFAAFDRRLTEGFAASDKRTERLEDAMSRQFLWLVGIQVTTLATIVAAILAGVLSR